MMKQGRRAIALFALIAMVAMAATAVPALAARKSGTSTATASAKAKQTTRQFTGVVTALDKTSLTVEKGGKNARTLVFTRSGETRTVGGDIEKDRRVTVHYRADGRELVAVRVVVKPASAPGEER